MLRNVVRVILLFVCTKSENEIEGLNKPVQDLLKENQISQEVADVLSFVDYKRFGDTLKAIAPETVEPPLLVFALTLEELKDHLKPGNKVLDVSGWGGLYLSVCMASMVGESGRVVVVHINTRPLVNAMEKLVPHFLEKKRILIFRKNPVFGAADYGPYDAVHAGPVCDTLPLLKQLNYGGRMLVPEDTPEGHRILAVYDKDKSGNVTKS